MNMTTHNAPHRRGEFVGIELEYDFPAFDGQGEK
jgi:hypothetical protein